jgi:hypothetical protein
MGGKFATSPVQVTPSGTYAAISHDLAQGAGGEAGVVDIYSYVSGAWQDEATLGIAHFTGGAVPDFFVTFAAADHTSAVIAADLNGAWQLLGVQGQPGPVLTNATVIDPTLVSQSVNSCNPTCVSGTITDTTYRFDPAVAKLVPTGPSTTEN